MPSAAGPTPAFSPAATADSPPGLIAFARFDVAFGAEGRYLGTAIARPDGSNERILVVPIKVEELQPAWSPDGRRLLVTFWTPSDPLRHGVVNADGSDFVRLAVPDVVGDIGCSDWSPDGQLFVCGVTDFADVADFEPSLDGIYTLRPDGTGLTRVTTSPFHFKEGSAGTCGGGEGRGVFSPDGLWIAFIRQRCGSGANPSSDESAAIGVVKVDGTGLREIVPQGGVRSHPGSQLSWSPDSAQIAFGSQDGELFLVDPDGTALEQIRLPDSIGRHLAYGPDWSPDGTRIVFSMFVESRGSTDLYTIAPDGSELDRITDTPGAETYVRWALPKSP